MTSRPARLGNLATGLLGTALLLPFELWSLGAHDAALLLPVMALFATLGVGIGLALAGGEALVATLRVGPALAALVRASASLLALFPLLRHLFDGGFAATLPGARWGHLVVPLVGWWLLAVVVWLVTRADRPRATAAGLALGACACQLANRHLYAKGYGDLHILLMITACVAAGLAIRGAVNGRAPAPPPTLSLASAVVVALVLATFGLTLRYGFATNRARALLASRWTDARQLVRLVRLAIDRDGDGYSAVLGGPDCDDANPLVNPLATEIPGNAIDEDCDGVAVPLSSAAPSPLRTTPPAGRARPFDDVLLLCVDAMRADLCTDTPDNRRDFPHPFALLDAGHVFRFAFATSSSTYISMPSILTGLVNPFQHIDRTLAEVMRASGRATHAVIPPEVLRWVGEARITRGFDSYDRVVGRRGVTTAAQTTDLGLRFVDAHPGPVFLWLHYFDVHEHAAIAAADPQLRRITGGRRLDTHGKYRALFGVVDGEVGRLVDELRRRGRWERTLVVLVGDHGEGLGDEPRLPDEHNEYVYNTLVHVPLVVRVPGEHAARDDEPVSIADIQPTLSELAGQPIPAATEGISLAPLIIAASGASGTSAHLAPRPIIMSDAAQYAVIAWPWKLLVRPSENLRELYDLSVDFGEHDDRSDAEPDRVRALNQLYRTVAPMHEDQSADGRRRREQQASQEMQPR